MASFLRRRGSLRYVEGLERAVSGRQALVHLVYDSLLLWRERSDLRKLVEISLRPSKGGRHVGFELIKISQ